MFTQSPSRRITALIVTVIFTITGCTSLHVIELSAAAIQSRISQGDKVVVVTNDGKKHALEVTKVTHTSLYAGQTSIPFTDMTQLQVKRSDTTKTVLLVVGIVAIAAAAGGEGGGGSGGGGGGY